MEVRNDHTAGRTATSCCMVCSQVKPAQDISVHGKTMQAATHKAVLPPLGRGRSRAVIALPAAGTPDAVAMASAMAEAPGEGFSGCHPNT